VHEALQVNFAFTRWIIVMILECFGSIVRKLFSLTLVNN